MAGSWAEVGVAVELLEAAPAPGKLPPRAIPPGELFLRAIPLGEACWPEPPVPRAAESTGGGDAAGKLNCCVSAASGAWAGEGRRPAGEVGAAPPLAPLAELPGLPLCELAALHSAPLRLPACRVALEEKGLRGWLAGPPIASPAAPGSWEGAALASAAMTCLDSRSTCQHRQRLVSAIAASVKTPT